MGAELYIQDEKPQGQFGRAQVFQSALRSSDLRAVALQSLALMMTTGLVGVALIGPTTPAGAQVPLPERKPAGRMLPERKPQGIPLPDRKPSVAAPAQTGRHQSAEDARPTEPPPVEKVKPTEPPHPSEIKTPDWTEQEIAEAKAACAKLFETVKIVPEPLAPLRKGQCGAPAPVKVRAIGAEPPVEIAPSATLRCGMVAALERWFAEIVQPAAAKHLGEPVIRIRNVASYVCRPRYNDRRKRISEHALANALDIAAFETKSGKRVVLRDHWVSLAKEKAEEPDETKAAGQTTDKAPNAASPERTADATTSVKEASADGTQPKAPETDNKQPSSEDAAPAPKQTPQSAFLRAVHEGACKIFGTVLGPEANAAHRDHFHLDLVKRRSSAYCR